MWAFITTVIIGFFIGLVARALMPGKQGMGFILTTLLGIAGSVVMGYLGKFMGWYEHGSAPGFIMSVIGAILLLALVGLANRK